MRPVGATLLHADRWTDGQTDITKVTRAFRDHVNARRVTQ